MSLQKVQYENAWVLMAGVACTGIWLNQILAWCDYPIPGIAYVFGLGYALLSLWAGLLVSSKMKKRRCWVTVMIALATLWFLYKALHDENPYWGHYLYCQMMLIGVGMLWPRQWLERGGKDKGWETLVMLLLTTFCYTALFVVRRRLLWGGMMPEHRDMQVLMRDLLRNTEPLMTLLVGYFAVGFAFSEWGQWLGSRPWFRGFVLIPTVMAFLGAVSHIRPYYMGYWTLLLWLTLMVQPVTVWMFVSVGRRIKRQISHKRESEV